MIRWLIISTIFTVLFLMSDKFDISFAIVGGLMCGGMSILAVKLFGMDK